MALSILSGSPSLIGYPLRGSTALGLGSLNVTLLDATNEACHMIGQVFWDDGGSHTIDTTGSSSLGWRAGVATFTNVATNLVVGLAGVDTATGPPGRAANVADVITFDVSKTYTSAAPPGTSTWVETVPTSGTKTIANGATVAFCVQMTVRGGADAVNVASTINVIGATDEFPFVTDFIGASYSAKATIPDMVITASDGTLGFFVGAFVAQDITTQTWDNTSGTVEYGNLLQPAYPGTAYGVVASISLGGDADIVLYSDPLGTPISQASVSCDANVIGIASASRQFVRMFPTPYSFTANQPLGLVIKPTTATSVSSPYISLNISNHQKAYNLGTNCYAINRASGAFAAQNSNKDRFAIGLLVGAFDDGTSAGGGPVGQQCM